MHRQILFLCCTEMAAERCSLLASYHICVSFYAIVWAVCCEHALLRISDGVYVTTTTTTSERLCQINFLIQMLRFNIRPLIKSSYIRSTQFTYMYMYNRTFTFSRFLYISIYFEKLVVWPVFFLLLLFVGFFF